MKTLTALLRKAQEIAPAAEAITMQTATYYDGFKYVGYTFQVIRVYYKDIYQHEAILRIAKNFHMTGSNTYFKYVDFTTWDNYDAAKAAKARCNKFEAAFYAALREGLSDKAAAAAGRAAVDMEVC